jgi:hypothetical protein
VGCGGAIGLRAIGWHFVAGGPLSCPDHRPDGRPCVDASVADNPNLGKPCGLCSGEDEANRLQVLITDALAGQEPRTALVHVLHHGRALCGLPGVPAEWPASGDRWVDFLNWTQATCTRCRLNVSAREFVAATRRAQGL